MVKAALGGRCLTVESATKSKQKAEWGPWEPVAREADQERASPGIPGDQVDTRGSCGESGWCPGWPARKDQNGQGGVRAMRP